MIFALGFKIVFPRMTRLLRDPSYSFSQKAVLYLVPAAGLGFLGTIIGFGILLLLRSGLGFTC